MTSPPYSSATSPYSVSCWRTLAGVGVGLVDLVHRDHDRHVRRLGVVERLHRLRHDAVVGGDHEDREVGHLRTTGTHGGERLVTRGVDEGDRALDALVLGPDLVRTDVLRDAAGLARDHVGLADGVEQSRLTVVDVTHDGHDRRTDLEVFLVLRLQLGLEVETEALEELLVLVLGRDHLDLVAELGAEHLEGRLVERLGRGRHLTQVEEDGDERAGLHGVAARAPRACRRSPAIDAPRRRRMISPLPLRDVDAADDRRSTASRIPAASHDATCAASTCRRPCRRHPRCHRRGHGHGRHHRRDDRRSRPRALHRERRRDAGSHRRRRRRDDRDRRDAAGTGRRDDRRHRDDPHHPDAERRGEEHPGAEPGDAGCCRGVGRWPMPCADAKGLLPGRGPAGR